MKTSLLLIFGAATMASSTALAAPEHPPIIALFEAKCASCHHDKKKPELSASTSLNELRSNTKYVLAGDAENSPLYQSVMLPPDHEDRMPKSTEKKPLKPLTTEEKAVIKDWIDGKAAPSNDTAAPVSTRKFIDDRFIDDLIVQDLQKLTPAKRAVVRYITLANPYNEKDAKGNPMRSDEMMDLYRAGVSKMLNSVSNNPEIVNPVPLDEAKTVLRFSLADYGLTAELWKRIADQYPYKISDESPASEEAQQLIGALHRMRGDFFVFALAQSPFYYDAIGMPGADLQPAADVKLEAKLGIDYDKAIQEPGAVRGGFQQSGVSQGNRMIERLPREDGHYYWKSYDFDPTRVNDARGNLFKAPLGPVNSELTKNGDLRFSHDGGEIFWSLPNGLQAYALTDAVGKRLDIAPLNVVTDSKRADKKIFNGISCIACHAQGTVAGAFKDQVLSLSSSLPLSPEDKATVKRLFDQEKLSKYLSEDSARFMEANKKCGVTGTEEPVLQLYNLFKADVTAGSLAGEIGADVPDVLKELNSANSPEVKNIAGRLASNTPVPRDNFQKAFPQIIEALGLGKVKGRDQLSLVDVTPEKPAGTEDSFGQIKGEPKPVIRLRPQDGQPIAGGTPGMKVVPNQNGPSQPQPPVIRRIGLDGGTAPSPGVGGQPAPTTGNTPPPIKKIGLPGTPNLAPGTPAAPTTPPTEEPPPADPQAAPPPPKIKKIGL